jgi:hypothetical protein
MKIFAPCKVSHWGDNINNLWAAEYIKYKRPEWEVMVEDRTPDQTLYRQHLKLDWITPTSEYTHLLCTHHRHVIKSEYNIPIPKIFFDSSGMTIRFIAENWYPSFIPQEELLQQFASLNLPEKYNVIHFSRCVARNGNGFRTCQDFNDFSNRYHRLTTDLPTVSTGKGYLMPNTIDLTTIPPMLKLYVMIRAENIFVSHSGFTAMAALYRRRVNSFVLDTNRNDIQNQLGPPIHSFSNVQFSCNMYKAFYNMEQFHGDYFKHCMDNEMATVFSFEDANNIPNQFMQFPDTTAPIPNDFKPQAIYIDKENCPVADLKIIKIYDI